MCESFRYWRMHKWEIHGKEKVITTTETLCRRVRGKQRVKVQLRTDGCATGARKLFDLSTPGLVCLLEGKKIERLHARSAKQGTAPPGPTAVAVRRQPVCSNLLLCASARSPAPPPRRSPDAHDAPPSHARPSYSCEVLVHGRVGGVPLQKLPLYERLYPLLEVR